MGLEMMDLLIGVLVVVTIATIWVWVKNTNG